MAAADAESYEEFVALLTRHEANLRAFTRALLPRWQDVDEVMQRTSLALWRKFGQFERGTDFLRWGCVVARFEVMTYRRQMARDRLVFSEDVVALLAEQAAEEITDGTARREERALERCVQKLLPNQRELVTLAYTDDANLAGTKRETSPRIPQAMSSSWAARLRLTSPPRRVLTTARSTKAARRRAASGIATCS